MKFENVYIPYGAYWSTPFARWQGSLSNEHSMKFAAGLARQVLEDRGIALSDLDGLHLGLTVPQKNSFYGAPWVAAMMGNDGITGPAVAQACATSARVVVGAAQEVDGGAAGAVLAVLTDRTSNGPHVYYPNPVRFGGTGESEDWVWDNFNRDPYAKNAMIDTAENVAREAGIDRASQEEVVLIRHAQYKKALEDDQAFQKRYMVLPLEVKDASGRKTVATVTGDEGVFPTTAEGLAKLRPVLAEGTVTFGAQTYPADGCAGLVVTNADRARSMARDASVTVQVLSFGEARAKKGFMAQAVVPAARQAAERAGVPVADMKAIKTHNPFAVNDVYFARELELDFGAFNNFGSPLIYGHPQAPTGARVVLEMIEELVLLGGGNGLFSGCAAGDTAMALVLRVDVK